jgi:ATP-dependent DNA ligase
VETARAIVAETVQAGKAIMSLDLKMPFAPMDAQTVEQIPQGRQWQYEPKWDGFRCLVFRDGERIELQAKSGKSLTRYFPDVVETIRKLPPKKFVLDSEIVIPVKGGFSFDYLLQRIHPAESRVRKLAKETPALLVVFDLLADTRGRSLVVQPLSVRRPLLEEFAAANFPKRGAIQLSPASRNRVQAEKWLCEAGATMDGVIAKRVDLPYKSAARTVMVKIKNIRTADCVVGGFRYASGKRIVGSLLLGLYEDAGLLHHIGFTSSVKRSERAALTKKLEALCKPPGFTGRAPGGPSRWSSQRSGEWEPLAPKLVVEVSYDHFAGGRFRHGTKFLRWRPDKAAHQCTMDQVKPGQKKPRPL